MNEDRTFFLFNPNVSVVQLIAYETFFRSISFFLIYSIRDVSIPPRNSRKSKKAPIGLHLVDVESFQFDQKDEAKKYFAVYRKLNSNRYLLGNVCSLVVV